MAFTYGFFHVGIPLTGSDSTTNKNNLNKCLVGYGPKADFPTAATYVSTSNPGNEGMLALATDQNNLYLSKGAAWVLVGFCPPGSLAAGDIFYYNGTGLARLGKGTQNQLLIQGASYPYWGSGQTIVRKTSNQTVNNSDTPVNDTELYFPIAANDVWDFQFYLWASLWNDSKMYYNITVPSGATGGFTAVGIYGATITTLIAFGTNTVADPNGGDGAFYIFIRGLCVNGSNAGNIQLMWSQYTAHSENTIVEANSHLVAWKLN